MTSILSKATSRDKGQSSPTKGFFGRKALDDEDALDTVEGEDAPSTAPKEGKTRKRKGSLRKTALLGGKHILSVGRERKGSLNLLSRPTFSRKPVQEQEQDQEPHEVADTHENGVTDAADEEELPPLDSRDANEHDIEYENDLASNSAESSLAEPPAVTAARLSLLTDPAYLAPPTGSPRTRVNELGSPVEAKSPASQKSYTSTTDDDDVLTFSRPAKSFPSQSSGSIVTAPSLSQASSYLEVEQPSSSRLRRASKRSSPLSRSIPLTAYPSPDAEAHDYTETEYWGWLLLFVTWLTFTVGMGSCLGIWSWAWDVGEKPNAPEELEDDETLPIVGYYPALMVLTGVVAWVWITVAWVGMKYFRHAKIEV